ncbi:AEC family transporter [Myxococcota bacterium]|nr:AEC family transporter [Myxococcota bacterium]
MSVVIGTIVPVFAVVGVGYLLASRRGMDRSTIADLSLLVTSPCLMFTVLSESPVSGTRALTLVTATLATMAGTALLVWLATARNPARRRGMMLPAVFWNSGNMGLACARLAFGPEGLDYAAVVFVTVAIVNSSAGIWIAKGHGGLAEVARMPLVYASAGGALMAFFGLELPVLVAEPIEMLAAMAIPLMLLNLGAQLRTLVVTEVIPAVIVTTIRMGGGLACMWGFTVAFDVTGVARQVLLLQAVMPAAVINVVMAQRYGTEPSLVASAIVSSTLASLVAIPAVLLWVG